MLLYAEEESLKAMQRKMFMPWILEKVVARMDGTTPKHWQAMEAGDGWHCCNRCDNRLTPPAE